MQLQLQLRVVFYTTASIAIAFVAFNHRQSRLVKGRARGLPLAESVLVVVFISHIIVAWIPVVAGADSGHCHRHRHRYRYRCRYRYCWFGAGLGSLSISIDSYRLILMDESWSLLLLLCSSCCCSRQIIIIIICSNTNNLQNQKRS